MKYCGESMAPKWNVLYVEDDPDIRLIGHIALSDIGGFNVRACRDGYEALLAIEHFVPDMMVLDIRMPGMTGIELATRLRGMPALMQVPLVFMTAELDPWNIPGCLELDVRDIVAKPFDPMTLVDRLRAVAGHLLPN